MRPVCCPEALHSVSPCRASRISTRAVSPILGNRLRLLLEAAAATKLVYEFSEGSRDMRDLLGGKGANVAEMTRVLGAERVPAGLHDHHRGMRGLHGGRRQLPRRPAGAGGRGAGAAWSSRPGSGWATATTRCWCRCAPARGSRCPGCSTPCSTLGSTTSPWRGWRRPRATSASRGTPTGASCRCSATSAAASPASRSRTRSRRARGGRRRGGHRAGVDDLKALTDDLKELFKEKTGEDFPQDPRDQLDAGDPGGVRLLAGRPRRGLPPHQPHPRRVGHRGERAADGVRQQGRQLVQRRGVLARRGDRRAHPVRRLPAQRAG